MLVLCFSIHAFSPCELELYVSRRALLKAQLYTLLACVIHLLGWWCTVLVACTAVFNKVHLDMVWFQWLEDHSGQIWMFLAQILEILAIKLTLLHLLSYLWGVCCHGCSCQWEWPRTLLRPTNSATQASNTLKAWTLSATWRIHQYQSSTMAVTMRTMI
jgi:hypothetical protein